MVATTSPKREGAWSSTRFSLTCLTLLSIVAIQSGLLCRNAFVHSPVWDEPGHLVAGLNHWRSADFRLYAVNPPLYRMLVTLPAAMSIKHKGVPALEPNEMIASRGEFRLGSQLFEADPQSAFAMLTLSRLVSSVTPVVGSVLLFCIAKQVFQSKLCGIVSSASWAFCPLVLGHGSLLPPDIAAAVALMLVCLAFDYWLRNCSLPSSVLFGVAFGLALLTKTTFLILAPWIVCSAVLFEYQHARRYARCLGFMAAVMITSIIAVNMFYNWSGAFKPLGSYRFVSSALSGESLERSVIIGNRFSSSVLGTVPVPLPHPFVQGIDVQRRDFERYNDVPYLLGEWNDDGFYTLYVWYFLLKLPIGLIALFLLGIASCAYRSVSLHDRTLFLLVTSSCLVCFVFISWQTGINSCQRYALIALPGICLTAAAAVRNERPWVSQSIAAIAVGCILIAGVGSLGRSLSFYNALAGFAEHGRYTLSGSATDWGQDLWKIAQWCRKNTEKRPLHLALVGYPVDLRIYEIEADAVRFDQQVAWPFTASQLASEQTSSAAEQWMIISFVHLLDPRSPYHRLLYRPADGAIGDTHAIYHLRADEAEQILIKKFPRLSHKQELRDADQ